MKNFDEIFEVAKKCKRAVAVAVAAAGHLIQLADEAVDMGIADMILVGDAAKIRQLAADDGIDVNKFEIIDEPDDAAACRVAVRLVRDGRAGALMKGDIDTSIVLRAILCREAGIRTNKKLSHIAVFEPPTYHKLLFAADCAINIAPDMNTKIDIIENTVSALHNLGIDTPKVALLAAKEKVDKNMPITQEYADIVAIHKTGERMEGCIIDGPMALDNAVSAESCGIKGICSVVCGDADILIAPNIEAGNILYKALSFIARAKNGGVVVGAARPIILTSRADSNESKLISIALSVLF